MQDTLTAAKNLLGKYIARKINGKLLTIKITETEAYIGAMDKACHAYAYKRTKRTNVMFEKGGAAYVYLIYGMYYCLNVVTEKEGEPCAVLIREGEPVCGLDEMSLFRYRKKTTELTKAQKKNLTNGPGKICKALQITGEHNGCHLWEGDLFIFEGDKREDIEIEAGRRININYAEEASDYLWRFTIKSRC